MRREYAGAHPPALTLPLGEREVLGALRAEAHPLSGDSRDYDALMALGGDARIVLLGEEPRHARVLRKRAHHPGLITAL